MLVLPLSVRSQHARLFGLNTAAFAVMIGASKGAQAFLASLRCLKEEG
jgi:hypothetical protein